MALASTTVFEVRPASGSDANGGGFDSAASGSDFSQQAAAQTAFADIVIDATTNTKCTSAANPFSATSPGNIINITAGTGFLVQRVQIVSVVAGVATCDKSLGTLGSTGGTGNLGGSMATINAVEPLLTAGMKAWIKADGVNQVLTTSIILAGTGDSTSGRIFWNGYHTTRGDHDGTRPIITSSTNSVDIIRNAVNTHLYYRVFDNLEISSTAVTPGNGITSGTGSGYGFFWTISNCYLHGLKNGIIGDNLTYNIFGNLTLVNCEIASCTNDGVQNDDTATVIGCYLHGNSGYGYQVKSTSARLLANFAYPVVFRDSVIYGNSLGGIYVQAASATSNTQAFLLDIDRCAIVSNTNDGIQIATANGKLSMLSLQNSIIYGNSGYGVNITNVAATIVLNRVNAYGSNTSGARNNLAVGTGDVTLTADPFTAKASNDFSLNATAGGGAACKALGFPGTIAGCASSGSADIGAQQSAGGASVTNILSFPRRVQTTTAARYRRFRPLVIPAAPVTVPLVFRRRQVVRVQTGSQRPRSTSVLPAAPVTVPVIMPVRRRQYPVYYPIKRSVSGAALLVAPAVVVPLRPIVRNILRQNYVRRNAGNALFSSVSTTINNTVLVTSPRKVR